MSRRDRALVFTGFWTLVTWVLLFTRDFSVIVIGFILLAIPLALVFWQGDPWKRYQRVIIIIELLLILPVLILLIMTSVI